VLHEEGMPLTSEQARTRSDGSTKGKLVLTVQVVYPHEQHPLHRSMEKKGVKMPKTWNSDLELEADVRQQLQKLL
jgi:hypothetical protein